MNYCDVQIILLYSAPIPKVKMITRIEFSTGLKNIDKLVKHPSLAMRYLTGGRKSSLKKAVEISLHELSKLNLIDQLTKPDNVKMHSLIGKMGGLSQETLYYIVQQFTPRVVVETGVYRGISSAFILGAISRNGVGRLYSIDLPLAKYLDDRGKLDYSPLASSEETGFAIPSELKNNWSLKLGDSRKELPLLLENLGTIDMFYHDSEHTYDMMMWEYVTVFPHLRKGAIICSDDISWNTAFQDFCIEYNLTPHYVGGKFGFAIV